MKLTKIISFVVIAILSGWQGGAQSSNQDINIVTRLPLVGDETSINAIVADPRKFMQRPIVICGTARIYNYYNFNYTESSATYFSLDFVELTKDMQPAGTLTVYAARNMAEPMVNEILKVQQRGEGHRKVVRLKVMVTSRSFSDDGSFDDDAELIDWQFINSDRSGWAAWGSEQIATERAVAAKEQNEKIAAAQKLDAERAVAARKASQKTALNYDQEQADKGDSFGLLRMGERYREGDGVPKDLDKARDDLSKAAASGSPSAAEELSNLNQISTNSSATH